MPDPPVAVLFGLDRNNEQRGDHRLALPTHGNQGRPAVDEGGRARSVIEPAREPLRNRRPILIPGDQYVRAGVMREPALRVRESCKCVGHFGENTLAQIPAKRLPSGLRSVGPAARVRRRAQRGDTALAPDGTSCRRRPVCPSALGKLGAAGTAIAAVLQLDENQIFGKLGMHVPGVHHRSCDGRRRAARTAPGCHVRGRGLVGRFDALQPAKGVNAPARDSTMVSCRSPFDANFRRLPGSPVERHAAWNVALPADRGGWASPRNASFRSWGRPRWAMLDALIWSIIPAFAPDWCVFPIGAARWSRSERQRPGTRGGTAQVGVDAGAGSKA